MFSKTVGLMAVSMLAFAFSAHAVVVSGKISSDSANGSALGGATVIIAPRFGQGTTDTVTSAATTGLYSFPTVTAGVYGVTVSKTGYATKTVNVNIVNVNDTVNVFLLPATAGKVMGTITADSLNGSALSGVKVVLTTRSLGGGGGGGGGTAIDSQVTSANGKYTFANVPSVTGAETNYSVVASKTGYTTKTANVSVTGTATDTADMFLAVALAGQVIGRISADSLSGVALSGVKVVLATRGTGDVGAVAVDSLVTGADGRYAFSSVERGNYSVIASKTGYAVKTGTAMVGQVLIDTVNMFLVPVQQGNLLVFAGKSTDSTRIAGAAVTVTVRFGITAAVLSGTTDANGWALFSGITTGEYGVSVSAAGYTARSLNTTVVANQTDTVKAYLVVSAEPTKLVKGVVTDSVGGAPLAGVLVSIRVFGGTGMITITDSTNASGAYSIAGIPSGTATVTLTAAKTGYIAYTSAAVTTSADTTTFNFKMRSVPVGVIFGAHAGVAGTPLVSMQGCGFVLSGISGPARLTVVGLDGKTVYAGNINAGTRSIAMSSRSLVRGSMLIATVKQNGAVYRSTLLVH